MPSRTLAMHRRILQGQIQNICVPLHLQQANMQRNTPCHVAAHATAHSNRRCGCMLALRLLQCRRGMELLLVYHSRCAQLVLVSLRR